MLMNKKKIKKPKIFNKNDDVKTYLCPLYDMKPVKIRNKFYRTREKSKLLWMAWRVIRNQCIVKGYKFKEYPFSPGITVYSEEVAEDLYSILWSDMFREEELIDCAHSANLEL